MFQPIAIPASRVLHRISLRRNRDYERGRRAAEAAKAAGANALGQALAQIDATFGAAATANVLKMNVEHFISLGAHHPAFRGRYGALAILARNCAIDDAIAIVEQMINKIIQSRGSMESKAIRGWSRRSPEHASRFIPPSDGLSGDTGRDALPGIAKAVKSAQPTAGNGRIPDQAETAYVTDGQVAGVAPGPREPIDAVVEIVERWYRTERKAFQLAGAFGSGSRMSLDVLSELRLMLRLARRKLTERQFRAVIAGVLAADTIAAE